MSSLIRDALCDEGGVVDMAMLDLFVQGNEVLVSSLQVAETFGKDHKNVLRDVDNLYAECETIGETDFWRLNFESRDYVDARGKTQRVFDMNKDGFAMLAMRYTGPKATQFKIAYIKEFNRRGELLRGLESLAMQVAAEHKYYSEHIDLVEMDDYRRQEVRY